MSSFAFFVWILNIFLEATGHLAFKFAAIIDHASWIDRWKAMLRSFPLWVGVLCFSAEFVAWFVLLSLIPLSLAMLLGSINIVVVLLISRVLFHEHLSGLKLCGVFLITCGVILVGSAA